MKHVFQYIMNAMGKKMMQTLYSEEYGRGDVVKYTFCILQKMYADPSVIEHFGMETKHFYFRISVICKECIYCVFVFR